MIVHPSNDSAQQLRAKRRRIRASHSGELGFQSAAAELRIG
jgi:hypothetical protein